MSNLGLHALPGVPCGPVGATQGAWSPQQQQLVCPTVPCAPAHALDQPSGDLVICICWASL